MRHPGAFAVLLLSSAVIISACAGEENPIKAKADVDLTALKAELIANHDVDPGIDMDEWYDLAADLCDDSESEMRIYVAHAIDNQWSIAPMRASLPYVCPSRGDALDTALAAVQESSSEADFACSLPVYQRTEHQQFLAEAVGCA